MQTKILLHEKLFYENRFEKVNPSMRKGRHVHRIINFYSGIGLCRWRVEEPFAVYPWFAVCTNKSIEHREKTGKVGEDLGFTGSVP